MTFENLIDQLRNCNMHIESSDSTEGMFYISVDLEDDDPLLLDATEFETTGDIFVVGDTPYWFLESPASTKTQLATMSANTANINIAMSRKKLIGSWYFDISPTFTDDIEEGAICKFIYFARIPGEISPKDLVLLIKLAIETFCETKSPLLRFAEKDDVTVDDALDFCKEKEDELDIYVDSNALKVLKKMAEKNNEKGEDPLKLFADTIKEAGLDNS